ncbi:hypothetical protein D3C71_1479640 [compost metagenome]
MALNGINPREVSGAKMSPKCRSSFQHDSQSIMITVLGRSKSVRAGLTSLVNSATSFVVGGSGMCRTLVWIRCARTPFSRTFSGQSYERYSIPSWPSALEAVHDTSSGIERPQRTATRKLVVSIVIGIR